MPIAVSCSGILETSPLKVPQVVENGLATEHQPIGDGIGLAQVLGNNSEEAPLHCGSFTIEPGKETTTDYSCTCFSLILEGMRPILEVY
jgi:hypothetical protein